MPRGRNVEAQQAMKPKWAEGAMVPAPEADGAAPEDADPAAPEPEQPHLPGLKPTLVDRQEWNLRILEEDLSAIRDRLRKSQAKYDEDSAIKLREIENARLVRERLLSAMASEAADAPDALPWPAGPQEGTIHSVVQDGWQHLWTYSYAGGWQLSSSARTPDIRGSRAGEGA